MKNKQLFVLLLSAPLLLASCNSVKAKFLNGETKLTSASEKTLTIDHDTLEVIYKKIKDGGTYSSDTRDLLKSALSKLVIGDYEIVKADNKRGFEVKLNGYDGESDAVKAEFIKNHDAYKNWDHTGYQIYFSDAEPTKAEFEARVEVVKGIIETQVIKTMWGEANTSSYKRNNRFYERLYAKSMNDKLYTVVDKDGKELSSELVNDLYENPDYKTHYILSDETAPVPGQFIGFKENDEIADWNGFTNGKLIDYSFTTSTEEGLDEICGVLHIPYYMEYVNESVLPNILNNLLVEQYILEKNYSAVGITQKREIEYLKIEDNNTKNGEKFMSTVINNQLLTQTADELKNISSPLEVYEWAQETWKALPGGLTSEQVKLANATFGDIVLDKNPSASKDGHEGSGYIQYYSNADGSDIESFPYYEHTEYYDLIEKYSTVTNSPDTNNSSNAATFTSVDSINYDPIVGLAIRTDELKVKGFTTRDWQTKDSSTIPEAAKNKLYSYGFAYEWTSAVAAAKNGEDFSGSYIFQKDINGTRRYFLMKDSYNSVSDSILWQDGSNFYVIEVSDIVTPEVLALKSDTSAAEKVIAEKKAREAAYSLASGSTYTTNAVTHYLQQCNLSYHDQSIYDFFNSNYPKLFENK